MMHIGPSNVLFEGHSTDPLSPSMSILERERKGVPSHVVCEPTNHRASEAFNMPRYKCDSSLLLITSRCRRSQHASLSWIRGVGSYSEGGRAYERLVQTVVIIRRMKLHHKTRTHTDTRTPAHTYTPPTLFAHLTHCLTFVCSEERRKSARKAMRLKSSLPKHPPSPQVI